jgi:hypothetical protein
VGAGFLVYQIVEGRTLKLLHVVDDLTCEARIRDELLAVSGSSAT